MAAADAPAFLPFLIQGKDPDLVVLRSVALCPRFGVIPESLPFMVFLKVSGKFNTQLTPCC